MKMRNGFTLVEILISLTLLTIILGAIYSSFFTTHRALERFENVSLKYHEARTGMDIMRREIESAFLESQQKKDSDKNKTAFIIKDRDKFGKTISELQFTAFSLKNNKLNTITYFIEERDSRFDLLKKEASAVVPSRELSIEVIEGIEGFTVETLFEDKWVKTWDTAQTGRLPEIVKISIELNDNGKKIEFTEYARPRIGREL